MHRNARTLNPASPPPQSPRLSTTGDTVSLSQLARKLAEEATLACSNVNSSQTQLQAFLSMAKPLLSFAGTLVYIPLSYCL